MYKKKLNEKKNSETVCRTFKFFEDDFSHPLF